MIFDTLAHGFDICSAICRLPQIQSDTNQLVEQEERRENRRAADAESAKQVIATFAPMIGNLIGAWVGQPKAPPVVPFASPPPPEESMPVAEAGADDSRREFDRLTLERLARIEKMIFEVSVLLDAHHARIQKLEHEADPERHNPPAEAAPEEPAPTA